MLSNQSDSEAWDDGVFLVVYGSTAGVHCYCYLVGTSTFGEQAGYRTSDFTLRGVCMQRVALKWNINLYVQAGPICVASAC